MLLDGKVVVITGAGRGIGREDDPGALPQASPLLFDRGREHDELFPREQTTRLLRLLRARRKMRSLQSAQEVLRWRARRAEPFVFSTGYSDHALRDDHHDRPVLKKPFKPQELVDAFLRILSC